MADTQQAIGRPGGVEITIGNVPLSWKLSAIDAALQAIQEAHRDTMPRPCWGKISQAREALAAAVFESEQQARFLPIAKKELPNT